MRRQPKLSASMSLRQFCNGYWYVTDLKRFARHLGIPTAVRLRKDELERAIEGFLRTETIIQPTRSGRSARGARDVDGGLRIDRRVAAYTNDGETKAFLCREARRLWPKFKHRSGASYRLNRWREDQLGRGVPLTYGDLVREYVRLCQSVDPFARVPHGRYINFVSDFLADQPAATRATAIQAWHVLKTLNKAKTYAGWIEHQAESASRLRTGSGRPRRRRQSMSLSPPLPDER